PEDAGDERSADQESEQLAPAPVAALAPVAARAPVQPLLPARVVRSPAGFTATNLRTAPRRDAASLRLLPNGTVVEPLGPLVFAPHQFAGPLWARLAPWLPAVAAALLLASLGLFLAAVVPGRRRLVILAHLSAGIALSLFLYNAVAIGAWSAIPIYLPIVVG